MHEASITSSIIDAVIDSIKTEGLDGTVTMVHITVGVCQGLVPESLKMYFEIGKPGTLLEHAELKVTIQGMIAHCSSCNTDYSLELPDMFCPDCRNPMTLVKGNEILITEIEVECDESDAE